MQRILVILFLIVIITTSPAQIISGRVSSSVYTLERYDSLKAAKVNILGFQQLQFNFGYKKFALRSSVNFENSFSGSLSEASRFRVYYLYAELNDLFDRVSLKLGRQPVFNGDAVGVYDGISLKAEFYETKLNLAYGGILPNYQKLSFDDFGKSYIVAGSISTTALKDFYFSAGYSKKNYKAEDYYAFRLDEKFDPIMYLIHKNSQTFEYLRGKAEYTCPNNSFNIRTKYEFDLNFFKTSKVELESDYAFNENWSASVYGNYREPRVRYNSIFSVFNYGNTKEVEGGLVYRMEGQSVTARAGYVKFQDESSLSLNAFYSCPLGSLGVRKTFSDAGELQSAYLQHAHSHLDGLITPSILVSFTQFKLEKNADKNNLLSVLAGVNVKPWKTFSVDLQGQYLDNPVYKNDIRFLIKLNYWFHQQL